MTMPWLWFELDRGILLHHRGRGSSNTFGTKEGETAMERRRREDGEIEVKKERFAEKDKIFRLSIFVWQVWGWRESATNAITRSSLQDRKECPDTRTST